MPLRPSVLLLMSLLGLTQCIMMQEEPAPADPMPAATQTGANTAGCVVDGQLWVARRDIVLFGPSDPAVSATWRKDPGGRGPEHRLHLSFDKSLDPVKQVHDQTSIELYLPDISAPGTFVFDQATNPDIVNGPKAYADFSFQQGQTRRHLTGPQTPGRLVVTRLDTVARIVSGTFEFTAIEVSSGLTGNGTPIPGGKTVRVTEGRFDARF